MRPAIAIGIGAVLLVVAAWVGSLILDPQGTVRVKNDGPTAVDISCDKAFTVKPGRAASLPVSVLNPVPCFVYRSTPSGTAEGDYLGCVDFRFSFGRDLVLSHELLNLSVDHCWKDLAPR